MNFIRSVLKTRKEWVNDPEKNSSEPPTLSTFSGSVDQPERPGTAGINPVHQDQETLERLAQFRLLVGIASTPSMTPSGGRHLEGRAAKNEGIYPRVVHAETSAKRNFNRSAKFINAILGIQIVVAAALTALGAANSNHGVITAFGAINTVIAGFLTYLKGSNLPGRFKYYYHEWRRVREFIEQRERDLSRKGCTLNVEQVVQRVVTMYEDTKTDVESSAPDNYISASKMRQKEKEIEYHGMSGGQVVTAAKSFGGEVQAHSQAGAQQVAAEAKQTINNSVQQVHEHEKSAVERVAQGIEKRITDKLDKL